MPTVYGYDIPTRSIVSTSVVLALHYAFVWYFDVVPRGFRDYDDPYCQAVRLRQLEEDFYARTPLRMTDFWSPRPCRVESKADVLFHEAANYAALIAMSFGGAYVWPQASARRRWLFVMAMLSPFLLVALFWAVMRCVSPCPPDAMMGLLPGLCGSG